MLWVTSGALETGTLTTKHLGFRIDDNIIYSSNADGVNQNTINLMTVPAASFLLEAILYPGEKIEFYVDGALKGTSTTYLPTGTGNAEEFLGIGIRNFEAVDKSIDVSQWYFLQEP